MYTNLDNDLGWEAINFSLEKDCDGLPRNIPKEVVLDALGIILECKGRTIIFLMGGYHFSKAWTQFFLNFSLSKQFFSEIVVRQTIYFFNLLSQTIFFLPWVILVSMELKVI